MATVDSYLIAQIYRAKLRRELEPTDFHLKRFITQAHQARNNQHVFEILAAMDSDFWAEFPRVEVLCREWAHQHGGYAVQLPVVWQSFIRRLSLESWLILGRDQKSHGNAVLNLLLEVLQDHIYLGVEAGSAPPPVPELNLFSTGYEDYASPASYAPRDSTGSYASRDPSGSYTPLASHAPRDSSESYAPNSPGQWSDRSSRSSIFDARSKVPETILEEQEETAPRGLVIKLKKKLGEASKTRARKTHRKPAPTRGRESDSESDSDSEPDDKRD